MKTIHQDKDLLVIDKPAGISVDDLENQLPEIDLPRNGIIHRLDKDTSGVLLVAKNKESLQFFQKQFKNREIQKTYIALVHGKIKQDSGDIETLIGRDGIKQKAYLLQGPENKKTGPRQAETKWKVIERYNDYTLLEVKPKTGRKHQIRVHLAYLGYPVVGDKLYSFKNQKVPQGLKRQFLHAKQLNQFKSELPEELKDILCKIK